MFEFDLRPYRLSRPTKIRWMYNHQAESLLSSLRSKTLTTFLSQSDAYLAQYKIYIEHTELNRESFDKWLEHYRLFIERKEYDLIATPEWLDLKKSEGKTVKGFFFYREEQLCGSIIYTRDVHNKVIAAFKTTSVVVGLSKKHRSMGALIDFIFVKEMLGMKNASISLGSMRNAFRVYNSEGNLDYKLRFGLLPIPKENTIFEESVPLDKDGSVIFFGMKDRRLGLFKIAPKFDTADFAQERFANPKLFVERINY